MKYAIGLDVGFTALGCIIFSLEDGEMYYKGSAAIRTEKNTRKKDMRVVDDDVLRIWPLVDGLYHFINERVSEHDRIYVVAELPTGGAQGARANRTMGIATGVVVAFLKLWSKTRTLNVEYVTPMDVKLTSTGHRTASKDEMMQWFLEHMLQCDAALADVPKVELEHIADAYGALYHAWQRSEVFSVFINN